MKHVDVITPEEIKDNEIYETYLREYQDKVFSGDYTDDERVLLHPSLNFFKIDLDRVMKIQRLWIEMEATIAEQCVLESRLKCGQIKLTERKREAKTEIEGYKRQIKEIKAMLAHISPYVLLEDGEEITHVYTPKKPNGKLTCKRSPGRPRKNQ